MKLIAKKPCNFGRQFFIGDEIPTECVLDPKAQEKMGVLVVVDEKSASSPENENAASNAGGSLLPPASTLGEEDKTESTEEESEGTTEEEESEEESEEEAESNTLSYTKNSLLKKNKAQLLIIAKEKGVEVEEDMTNAKIVELILESQGE